MNKLNLLALLLYIAVIVNNVHANEPLKFKNGDRICFLGNSITHGGSYHAFFQLFMATRYPAMQLEYYNCGISGDNANGMIERFNDDVLIHKPNYVFLMTGMNDVGGHLYRTLNPDKENLEQRQKALENYYLNTEKLAKIISESGAKPIFMTPTIFDETAKIERVNQPGRNKALQHCAEHIKKLAHKYNAPVVKLNEVLLAINLQGQKSDSMFTVIGNDRVHPGDFGHLIMAYEILNTLKPQNYVSKIEIDAKNKKVIVSKNCELELLINKGEINFKVKENALPFPIKESLRNIEAFVPFYESLNNQLLKVKNIDNGNYSLKIDDVEVGIFSAEQFEKGINLAKLQNTPQYKQAEQVAEHCFNFRKIQGTLRTIPHIEFRMLSGYEGDGSLESKRAFLLAKCETQKHETWYDYMLKTANDYFELLPKVDSLNNELKIAKELLYSANKPQWYNYKIISVKQ